VFADAKLLAFCALGALLAASPARCDDKPPTSLVRAKVKSVEEVTKGRVENAVLEIVHVYLGDSTLKGQTFHDTYRANDLRGNAAHSPFKVDEEGLWAVMVGTKGDLILAMDRSLPFRRRSQKSDPTYANDLKLAEVIESVYSAKEGDRAKKLIELTVDATPQVAVWAVRTLGASDDPAAEKYLKGFATKPDLKLPLQAQLVIDEVLCKVKRKEWLTTTQRMAMLKAWASGKADEDDARGILSRLDSSHQQKEVSNDRVCEVIRLAVANKDWPMEVRRYALTLIGMLSERAGDDSAVFDGLFDVIKNGQDSELRQAAASTLWYHIPLNQKRRKVVEEYLTTEKDTEVARILRSAIREGIKKDDK